MRWALECLLGFNNSECRRGDWAQASRVSQGAPGFRIEDEAPPGRSAERRRDAGLLLRPIPGARPLCWRPPSAGSNLASRQRRHVSSLSSRREDT